MGEVDEAMGAEAENSIPSLPRGRSSAENDSAKHSVIRQRPVVRDPDCGRDLGSTGGSLQGAPVNNASRRALDADQASDNDGGSSMCFGFDMENGRPSYFCCDCASVGGASDA